MATEKIINKETKRERNKKMTLTEGFYTLESVVGEYPFSDDFSSS